mmetsp:Transcript_2681/g.3028  ORF Transcript_2681/g.3028 Transcript_2681/m.3028 type:complete len:134 (+) Transcript_2681:1-402(+)
MREKLDLHPIDVVTFDMKSDSPHKCKFKLSQATRKKIESLIPCDMKVYKYALDRHKQEKIELFGDQFGTSVNNQRKYSRIIRKICDGFSRKCKECIPENLGAISSRIPLLCSSSRYDNVGWLSHFQHRFSNRK